MTRVLVPLPIALPLLSAAVSLLAVRRLALQRVVALATLGATLAATVALLVHVEVDGTVAVQAGDWPAPFGITLVVDLFAAIMLVVSAAMLLAVQVYSIGQRGTDERSRFFHPVYLVLTAGVSASFITGDLFNLFVAFEVMLTASYVLITLDGTRDQVRAGMTYVVISLVASMLFLATTGLVYAATGTLNMADLAGKLGTVPADLRTAFSLLLLVVFGVKAAIFPLFFWLPDSYPTAPTPVTAIFAGLLTKVGVYAIIRTQTLFFINDRSGPSTLILVIAAATMVVGVLGAIAQNDIKRILSFHIVSQIGYMILGLGLLTAAGIAGGIFYIVHHIIVKTTLFLVGGLVEHVTGTASLARVAGLARRAPWLAILFLLPALSLAGVPPLSGFVAKLSLVEAGFAVDRWTVVSVSLLVGLLTLFSMTKIWSGVFWGATDPGPADRARSPRPPALMVGATAALVALSLGVALAARPLLELSRRAADDLVDPSRYVEAVLGR